jgi:hypothetical protein
MVFLNAGFNDDRWLALFIWCFLGDLARDGKKMPRSEVLFDQWRFASVVEECLLQMGKAEWNGEHLISAVKMLTAIQGWHSGEEIADTSVLMQSWLDDPLVSEFLDINEHENVLWFNQEGIQEFLWWLMVRALLEQLEKNPRSRTVSASRLLAIYQVIEKIRMAEKDSKFQVKKLLELLKEK